MPPAAPMLPLTPSSLPASISRVSCRVSQLLYLHFSAGEPVLVSHCHCVSVMAVTVDPSDLNPLLSLIYLGLSSRAVHCHILFSKALPLRHLSHSRLILLTKMDCPGSAVAASCNTSTQMDASHLRSCRALQ